MSKTGRNCQNFRPQLLNGVTIFIAYGGYVIALKCLSVSKCACLLGVLENDVLIPPPRDHGIAISEQLKQSDLRLLTPSNPNMVFRLPTHLDSLIPPPSAQAPQARPWRGSFIVSGMRPSDLSSSQEIRVTAVETDGDNRNDLWPLQFVVQLTHDRPILRDVQAWVTRHTPPLCTFMPERLRDPNLNVANNSQFRSLSRLLFERQIIAIASWNTDVIPGDGIIIFPAQNSSAMLIGALFLSSQFPQFSSSPPPSVPISPTVIQSRQQQYEQQLMSSSSSSPYGSTSRQTQPQQPHARRLSNQSVSPTDPSARYRQDQYRHIMPRTMPPNYPTAGPSSAVDNRGWPAVKDEDEADFSAYTPTHQQYPE